MRTAVALTAAAIALAGCGSSDGSATSSKKPVELGTETLPTKPPRTTATTPPPREQPAGVERPKIVERPIPFPDKRKQEMAAYAERHYGIDDYRLENPKVIVEHITVTDSFESAYNTFAADVPDAELHELPGTCAHFVVDTDGTIYQLVSTSIMCRHTVGLNYTAIGIEHVAMSDSDLLGNPRQLAASLKLTNWLRCSDGIKFGDVIGHNESLSSPYHKENVASLRTQTHADMAKASMDVYRAKLRRLTC
jgi:N-acetylmuramoyl-L-alanine amidase